MTDINQVKQYIWDWVNNYLNVPNPDLASFPPCPYSRKVMLENRVKIQWFQGAELLDSLIEIAKTWTDDFEVVILVTDPKNISYNDTNDLITEVNQTTLARHNLVALRDHPDVVSQLPRSSASNGKYVLIFVQKLNKLLEATEHLSKNGYYQYWSSEELEDLVNWRFKLVNKDSEQ
ncbi:MAG: hypothetical protein ACYTXC_28695 [Nostoc sp.]